MDKFLSFIPPFLLKQLFFSSCFAIVILLSVTVDLLYVAAPHL